MNTILNKRKPKVISIKKAKPSKSGKINIARVLNVSLVMLLSFVMLTFFVKGDSDGQKLINQSQSERSTGVGSPFESSNSNSRYILTEALVENNSVFLTDEQAQFASPDLVYYNGKFLSIFMPGISFIGVPFYLLGKQIGMAQLFTYASVTLFGFINIFLIARIAYKLGANIYAGLLAGFLFLFGTNALSYSLFYTQHATGVAFLLLSILMILGKRSMTKNVGFGVFTGMSILLDIPNLILLTPIGIYLLYKHVLIQKIANDIKVAFDIRFLTVLLGIIPFIILLFSYNAQTTGSYTKLGQTIGRVAYDKIDDYLARTEEEKKSGNKAIPFAPRDQLNGMYTLLVSNERAWIFYSPIVLLGALGFFVLYKEQRKRLLANVLVGIVLVNIVLYSMFGDPWGGWAFGPRYLIPGAAILCIVLAVAIQQHRSKIWFALLFISTAFYSLLINVTGALTTGLIPPKIEAVTMQNPIPYTFEYNFYLLQQNQLSSLLYNVAFSHMDGWQYAAIVFSVLFIIFLILYHRSVITQEGS